MTQTAQNIASVADFLTGEIDLCSPPEIFIRISDVLDNPTTKSTDIAEIIEQDPSLAARMLKIVNSAFYGFPATVQTISKAITILGDREIRLLVMTTSVVEKFSSFPNTLINMKEFWSHSLEVALFAKFLTEHHPKGRQLSSIFISGLLHDIGRLVLYKKAPDLARSAVLLAKARSISDVEAEIATFGFSHADVGGGLLALWKIPDGIQNAAQYHHQPELSETHPLESSLVYLANALVHEKATLDPHTEPSKLTVEPIWEAINLSPRILPAVTESVNEQFNKTYRLFFGH
ncbi:MAG: metal-dependent phosphohydrolase [Piscirickettsiaceae bacterium]|nr:MAG: metal-dependent phosphohydrolase [Piscirickettsiaceae bacterium]